MKPMTKSILLAFASLCAPITSLAHLFADSPLQHAYQATLSYQPQLAWQELTLALNQHHIKSKHWLPVKNELLAQTACGTALKPNTINGSQLRLSMIKRSGLASQGYQFRVSIEQSSQPQTVTLRSPQGSILLEGHFTPQAQYQEVESSELLQKPVSGVFKLTLGDTTFDLLLAMPDNSEWLALSNQNHQTQVVLALPNHVAHCPSPIASWQWFDENYQLLGSKIPFQHTQEDVPDNAPITASAKYLSASVELIEYQQGARIEYIQRLAIPYQWRHIGDTN